MSGIFGLFWYWSGVICLGILLLVQFWSRRRSVPSNIGAPEWVTGARLGWILSTAVLLAALTHAALYLVVPNYADYGEPTVAILASNLRLGGPVYSDWIAGDALVGSNYGPYVFIIQAVALSISATILSSKIAGVVAAVATLALFVLALRTLELRGGTIALFCALLIAFSVFHLHYWFWNRPDPLLMALVALGAWLHARLPAERCLIALGLLAGLALNLKLFGAIYLVPLAVGCVISIGGSWRLARPLVIGGLLFALAATAPFASGAIDPWAYVANLLLMPNQGLLPDVVLTTLALGLAICLVPVMAYTRAGATTQDRGELAALIACTVLISILSGKPGGGAPYLLPVAPLALYLAGRACMRSLSGMAAMPVALIAVLACSGPIWAYSFLQIGRQLPHMAAVSRQSADLRVLYERFPGAEMALSSASANTEFLRVQKGFAGQVTRFDFVNYGDQLLAGVPGSVLHPFFERCRIPHWIMPRGGERMFGVAYDVIPMFDAGTKQRFATNYRLAAQNDAFEVWSCRR